MAFGFFGWRVVAAAFFVAVFGWGVSFYGPPVFLHAIHETRGWSVSLISSAITCHYLMGAACIMRLPALHERFGLAVITAGGGLATTLGFLAWALASEPWQLFAATLLTGFGWAATGSAAINAIVAPWFVRRLPAALGMAYNGASVGGALFSPLWPALIGLLGMAGAVAAVGVAMVATLLFVARRYLSATPRALRLEPDGAAAADVPAPASAAPGSVGGRFWLGRPFVTLAAGMSLGLFAQIGLLAHLYSLLVPVLGAGGAGTLMGVATGVAMFGRTAVGWLMPDGMDRRLPTAANYLMQCAGCAALLAAGGEQVGLLIAGVLLFGLGIGNAVSLPPLIARSEFPGREAPRAVAYVVACSQASFAFAPAAFGLLRDLHGAGETAVPGFFVAAGLVQVAAALAILAGRRRPGLSSPAS